MSTDDDLPETICPRWRLVLPAEPSEDELARHWSLTPADRIEIGRCRGDDHRRRFALQLCMLRTHGRFLEDYRQAPLRIVNHLSRQIGLAPVLFLDRPGRGQTERAQALRIRRYLGLKSFDRKAEEDLRDWLRQGALEGRSTTELLVRVEGRLRDWRIMLPAPGTLQRIVTSEVARATASLFDKVAAQLPAPLREAIDLLLEMPEGDARSSLFRLKDAPRSATAAAIKGDIVRLCLIEQLLGPEDCSASTIRRSGKRADSEAGPNRHADSGREGGFLIHGDLSPSKATHDIACNTLPCSSAQMGLLVPVSTIPSFFPTTFQ